MGAEVMIASEKSDPASRAVPALFVTGPLAVKAPRPLAKDSLSTAVAATAGEVSARTAVPTAVMLMAAAPSIRRRPLMRGMWSSLLAAGLPWLGHRRSPRPRFQQQFQGRESVKLPVILT